MFGYLKPVREELRVREYELYKSVYCGLCKHLGKDYGIISRFTLSYDCTVLAMLYISLKNETCCIEKGRCVFNPMKKCLFCDSRGEGFKFAGAVSVIMSYYKLVDSIEDSGFIKKNFSRFLKLIIRRSFKKASLLYPDIKDKVAAMMEQQRNAEKIDSGIDRAAEPTAKMLSELCKSIVPNDIEKQNILGAFGYYIGRWIYIMDAADDLERDIRHHNFNPFQRDFREDLNETMLHCNDVLNMTVSQIILAYDLMELKSYKEILDNIVYNGLSFQQKYCLFDKRCGKKCKKKNADYYPYLSGKNKSGF